MTAFWVTGAGTGELRTERLPEPAADQLVIRTLRSGISKGTELQVFADRVPPSQYHLMGCPHMEGAFPAPVKYGYCNVGEVEQGPVELVGRRVFGLFPHQTRYVADFEEVVPVPDAVPTERAVLTASMETALNATWDAEVKVGDRVAVIGLGTIGGLVAYLCAAIPGTRVTAFDVQPTRADLAHQLNVDFTDARSVSQQDRAARLAKPTGPKGEERYDVVFHTSACADGLRTALALCGIEARLVELSWHCDREVSLPLGENFHSHRLQLISSQVGRIPASQRSRWTYRRRLQLALSLLADPLLDRFLTGESPFRSLPQTMVTLAADPADTLCHSVVYDRP